jgi:Tol biopolymer transport system component
VKSRIALLVLAGAAVCPSSAVGSSLSSPAGHIVLGMNHYCLVGSSGHKQPTDCGKDEIAVVNADGSGRNVLTHDAVTETDPVWSPNGSEIAFLKPKRGASDQIWVMNANGTNQHTLTHFGTKPQVFGAENLSALSWSPDGQTIVFSAFPTDQGGREQLYMLTVRTHGVSRITNLAGGATNPVWSPNGRWIAYGSNIGNDRIYLRSTSTHRVHALRMKNGGAVSGLGLAWSPDSRSLAFNRQGKLVAFDTTTKLSKTLSRSGDSPSWSPDGQWVVFDDGGYVKEVRADGTGVRSILHVNSRKGHDFEPDWGR